MLRLRETLILLLLPLPFTSMQSHAVDRNGHYQNVLKPQSLETVIFASQESSVQVSKFESSPTAILELNESKQLLLRTLSCYSTPIGIMYS